MTAAAPTAVPELSAGRHFPALDAFRGIGMTMVLINHAAYTTGLATSGSLAGRIAARTDAAVPLFFVLSAFLLFRPFVARMLADRPTPATGRFLRRRALRIFPAYWVALFGIALIWGLPIEGRRAWVSNLFLLPALGVPTEACSPSGVCHPGYALTQAFTIGVEATFYLVLPLVALVLGGAARRARRRDHSPVVPVVVGVVALYLAGAVFRAVVVFGDVSWARQSLLWLPMYLDLFALGMGLAVLSVLVEEGRAPARLRTLVEGLAAHPVWCWVAGAAMVLALIPLAPSQEPFGLSGAEYVPRQLIYGVASMLWLWPALFGPPDAGRLRRALASPVGVYLGAVSLSFYLWHLAIMEQVKAWTVPGYDELQRRAANPEPGNPLAGLETFTGNTVLIVVITFVVTLGVASVLYRAVELPFLRLKDAPLRTLVRPRRSSR